jgi:IS30 family transposase
MVSVDRGATVADAAQGAGLSERTLFRRLAEEPVVVLRERKPRDRALSLEDRFEIHVGIRTNESGAEIAARIGRHRSVVWREIKANGGRDRYNASKAQNRADEAARRPKARWFETRPELWAHVVEAMVDAVWSPKAIAVRLHEEHPEEPQWWVSHEAIYQAIYLQARGELKKELLRCLRSGRTRRKPQGRRPSSASKITGLVSISERPAEAWDRAVPGHWEGDLVIGANSASAVATLVERSTRFGMLVKLESRTPSTSLLVWPSTSRRCRASSCAP